MAFFLVQFKWKKAPRTFFQARYIISTRINIFIILINKRSDNFSQCKNGLMLRTPACVKVSNLSFTEYIIVIKYT